MRIVRLANFVHPTSGGLRTALRELGAGYLAAGHEPVLVIPGPTYQDTMSEQGRVIQLPGPPVLPSYRALVRRRPLRRLLQSLAPDRIEVSDRTTLRWTGAWARRRGVPSVMVSHESLEGLLRVARLPRFLARPLNRATARHYDRVLCTTAWAAREFDGPVDIVPLGVDLDLFHPSRQDPVLRAFHAKPEEVLLVCCTRLSPEKRPQRALTTLTSLLGQGVRASLVFAGDGPLRDSLRAAAAGLPVTFTGFVHDRTAVASLLATADVVLAPGPIETFGLAALEALASGTPVVVSESSALPAVVGSAGAVVAGEDFSRGVHDLLGTSEAQRRGAARARAQLFSWEAATRGFLAVHESLG